MRAMSSSEVKVVDRILRGGKNLPDRMRQEPRIIVPENTVTVAEVKQYPNLNENDYRIRFNPFTGELYLSAYRHRVSKEINGAENNNPSQEIAQRWNPYTDVESAIRSAKHVLESYDKKDGKMVTKTLGAIGVIKDLLKRFESGEISEVNIDNVGVETLSRLKEYGFEKPQKPIKQKLAEQVLFAAGKDSLQRVNPLISRTRLASAWLKTTRELLVAKNIREKYSEVLIILSAERDIERMYIDSASKLMNDALRSEKIEELSEVVDILRDYFRDFLTSDRMRVAPYRKIALLAGYSLFGPRNDWDEKLIQGMGEEGKKAIEYPQDPIDDLLKKPEVFQTEVMQRLSVVLSSFEKVLDEGEKNLQRE